MNPVEDADIREIYDQWHARHAIADDVDLDLQNPWNRFVCDNLPEVGGKVVLEIACGRGQLSAHLAERGASVISADISTQGLVLTRRCLVSRGHQAVLLNADICSIPLADRSVDLVISCETVEHTPNPQKAFAEFHRVLKPGGELILTFPSNLNMTGLYRIYLWLLQRPYDSGAGVQPIEQWLISFRVLATLRKMGFRIVRTHGAVYNLLLPGFAPKRLTVIERVAVLQTLFKPFAVHFAIVAER